MAAGQWSSLPADILLKIFAYLEQGEKVRASTVCKNWRNAFHYPEFWREFHFVIRDAPVEHWHQHCLENHGGHFRHVVISVDQSSTENRNMALQILSAFANLERGKLESLAIKFTGENPLFYNGAEFTEGLFTMFGFAHRTVEFSPFSLRTGDFSGLLISYTDELLEQLAICHPRLENLNITSNIYCYRVSHEGLLNLARKCRNLKSLKIFHCTFSDDILRELASDNRAALETLTIVSNREDRYGEYDNMTTERVWQELGPKFTDLQMNLIFEPECFVEKIENVIKRGMPVNYLYMQNSASCFRPLNKSAAFFKNTLDTVVLKMPFTPALVRAFNFLGQRALRLTSLQVSCELPPEVIDEVYRLQPQLKEYNRSILKPQQD
ncbi:F-box/LRR-repeat protein 21-like [Saccostrea echinata]|uniref:F-box/LRR-repeat protein 21-like n=1 Tax=Saccostrea echinata TaxID=191078 RepID=UPI002A7EB55F|nr:F-box/LRR-repeat protein 21-like [Saccostrea echinata]